MNEEKKQGYWRDSMVIFGRISMWIIIPVLFAVFVGGNLDKYFGTKPWIFLGAMFFASLVTIYGIMKTIKIFMKNSLNKKDGE